MNLFVFRIWVSKSKWNLMFYKDKLVTPKKVSITFFESVTKIVMSFFVTGFRFVTRELQTFFSSWTPCFCYSKRHVQNSRHVKYLRECLKYIVNCENLFNLFCQNVSSWARYCTRSKKGVVILPLLKMFHG